MAGLAVLCKDSVWPSSSRQDSRPDIKQHRGEEHTHSAAKGRPGHSWPAGAHLSNMRRPPRPTRALHRRLSESSSGTSSSGSCRDTTVSSGHALSGVRKKEERSTSQPPIGPVHMPAAGPSKAPASVACICHPIDSHQGTVCPVNRQTVSRACRTLSGSRCTVHSLSLFYV